MNTTVIHPDNVNFRMFRSHRLTIVKCDRVVQNSPAAPAETLIFRPTEPDEYGIAGTPKKTTEYHPGRCLS